ncbi:MAG TPA: GtrA family protein [Chloroflexota bacterium]|nr:GtrA family protein [Chloroflexota bacterium]
MPSLTRVLRFFLAGGGSLALDLSLQAVLLQLLDLPVWLASGLSYQLALVVHFLVNDRWVFGQRRPSLRRLLEFQLTALTASLITYAVTNLLVYGPSAPLFAAGAGPYLAKIAGTAAATAWTFASSFFWIWRPRPAPAVAAGGAAPVASGAPGAPAVPAVQATAPLRAPR